MRDILKEAIMSAKIKWGTTVILVLATALAAEGGPKNRLHVET